MGTKSTSMSEDRSIQLFGDELIKLKNTSSRSKKEDILSSMLDGEYWEEKVRIISGEFSTVGFGESTVESAIKKEIERNGDTWDGYDEPTLTEELIETQYQIGINSTDRIDELVNELDRLADQSSDKSEKFINWILHPYQSPWVAVFALLDDMSLGVSHNTICNAAAPNNMSEYKLKQARGLYPNTVDFVRAMKSEDESVTSPEVGEPFAPMKAKSNDIEGDEDEWLAQPKLDGYRCTIHVGGEFSSGMAAGREIKAFSTNLEDRSDVLPELGEIDWPDGEWIFDSEVVSSNLDYGETSERMQRKSESELPHTMNFWVFDVIVADGKDVSQKPFEERMDILFENLPTSEYLVPVHAFEDIARATKEAERSGFEGLILKRRDHGVQYGERADTWVKAKMTEETVDLRVAGFEEGTGRNAGTLGAIELVTEDGQPLGTCGNGFTDRLRDEIWKNKYDWEDRIVEISFDADSSYAEGLRFPRYERLRDDKRKANSYERYTNLIE